MILTKEIKTLSDFENLKKGQHVACEFKRNVYDGRKVARFKVFTIAENKKRTKEIILQKKNNIYINYAMFLDSDECSNLKEMVLITCSIFDNIRPK